MATNHRVFHLARKCAEVVSVSPRAEAWSWLAASAIMAAIYLVVATAVSPAFAQNRLGFADLAEELLPGVVNISTTQTVDVSQNNPGLQGPPNSPLEDFFREFFNRNRPDGDRTRKSTSLGSGFIIDAKGLIITNHHVINNAEDIRVILHDKREFPAKVVGRDRKTDLAILKIESGAGLAAMRWGDSSKTRVGDWVLAIGNPFGLGRNRDGGHRLGARS